MAELKSTRLVDTAWLADHLGAADIRPVDATWFMPAAGRDARAEFEAAHIEGAVFFDIDDIAEAASDLPHMVPSAAEFSARVGRLGVGDRDRIVVYDNNHFSASARAWWMFRLFGHAEVAVLDGGLAKWIAEGRPVVDVVAQPGERRFTARRNDLLLRDLEQMRADVAERREQVLDVRSRGRFDGSEPEPRKGLRSGHIPGSYNLPYTELIATDGTMASPDRLRTMFAAAGIDLGTPIVTSCGSGVTAATTALALAVAGRPDVAVYDGSWSEWGSRTDTPVER